ncbi:MAG: CoB--CoM heterodisulfide reductase iron-sulfur subunit B family protein [Thermodesulfobacteriota bacterium]|nr:CoB--CoM heterodisulfide reductase iron-sulfur subunit B family protein [Thermodesulfobacteriota bacterium]
MKYTLFLGCTIPARSRNYELSARAVASQFGMEFIDIEEFSCCGFPLEASDEMGGILLAARNLALAEERGLEICSLCSACTSMLTKTAYRLNRERELKDKVNVELAKVGREYKGTVRVRHFARILIEDIGLERIKEFVKRDLKGLKVATHYGCHYLKPSYIYENFDDPQDPKTLEQILEAVGVINVQYKRKKDCCGGPVLLSDEAVALNVAGEKLKYVKEAGADIMNLVCPFCDLMFDSNQKGIEAEYGIELNIPVLYLPQILGLAMGLGRKELGLNLNSVNTKDLTARLDI